MIDHIIVQVAEPTRNQSLSLSSSSSTGTTLPNSCFQCIHLCRTIEFETDEEETKAAVSHHAGSRSRSPYASSRIDTPQTPGICLSRSFFSLHGSFLDSKSDDDTKMEAVDGDSKNPSGNTLLVMIALHIICDCNRCYPRTIIE
jgi:hypothetical protein